MLDGPELERVTAEAVEAFAASMLAEAESDGRKTHPGRVVTDQMRADFLAAQRERGHKLAARFLTSGDLYAAWQDGALHPANKRTRQMFVAITGVQLPPTIAATDAAIRTHLGAEFVAARVAERRAASDRAAAEKADAERAARDADNATFDGFGADLPPMRRGKTRAALVVNVQNNGRIVTRQELVREKVAAGWTVQDTANHGRVLCCGDHFLTVKDITAAAMDYAAHLLSLAAAK